MNTAFLGTAVALALLTATPAFASVHEDMNRMFSSSMVHVNSPGASMSMRRGIISGGSITVRNRNITTGPLFQLDPGFIASGGGCGGFDLNFGALSHISSDQLEQLMRSIPSAAVSYAFDLGLSSVSPQIQSLISKYTNLVNEIGSKYGSSCQIAKAMMDRSGLAGQITTAGNSMATSLGYKDDAVGAAQPGIGDQSSATAVAEANPEAMARMSPGNVIWKALKAHGADGWVEGGDVELLQDIMSLTGTYVACYPGVGGCRVPPEDASAEGDGDGAPEDKKTPKGRSIPAVLRLTQLVEGNGSSDGTNGSVMVNALRCDGSTSLAEGCLDPQLREIRITPMREKVLQAVRGQPGNDTDGIIGRMRAGGNDPSETDRRMLESMGKYGGILLFLARYNAQEAEHFADTFASQIAADMLKTYVEQLLVTTELATGGMANEPAIEEARKILADARTLVHIDCQHLTRSSGDSANRMLAYYSMTRQNALDGLAPARPTIGQR